MSLKPSVRIALLAVIALAAAGCAVAYLSVPPDARLGTGVRFAMFHGASTWVNMVTFTLAGAAGVAFALGVRKLRPIDESLRWLSLGMWVFNTVLGIMSMDINWGAVKWDEPKLLMTFGLLAGAFVILAVQLIVEDPRVPAVLDGVFAIALWTLVFAVPNFFHPDSPVFNSTDPAYRIGFFGMVGSIAVIAGCITVLVAGRPQAGEGHATS